MRTLFLLLTLTSFFGIAQSQVIQGVVTDAENQPIKYATIYIEELQTGSSANLEGKYTLSVPPGTYHVGFRSLGFSPHEATIVVGKTNVVYNATLQMQSYILEGVTVRADDENPAYSIMRKAIARAPGFVNQAKSYNSEVYIKGSVKVINIPKILAKRIEVNGKTPKTGDVYINESVNRIRFEAPDKYTQEVVSVNNTFPMGDNEVPVIGLISGSIYETQDEFYISPFAPNAFSHYNFVYDGLLQDGAWFIDKIKVIPKRKSKLLMEGYLYIVEDLWCLYSYDVVIHPQFVALHMKQHYAPVKGNNYFPVNLFVEADINAMGVKAHAVYTTSIKYTDVVIDPNFSQKKVTRAIAKAETSETQPAETEDPKVAEIDKKLDELLVKNELTTREMVEVEKLMSKKAETLKESGMANPLLIEDNYKQIVTKEALVRDSVYWDSIRPVPASADEKFSYQKQAEEQAKIDSTSAFKKFMNVVLFGNTSWERSKKYYVYYPGLLSLKNVGFNPVDGWQIKQSLTFRFRPDSTYFTELQTMGGYAVDRDAFFGKFKWFLDYAPKKAGFFQIEGAYLAQDYNANSGTPENINALYNLFMKENFINLYQNTSLKLYNKLDFNKGISLHTSIEYQQTDTLSNNTNFSVGYPNLSYAPNVPTNSEIDQSNLDPSKALILSALVTFTPKQPYSYNRFGRKQTHASKYPSFWLAYNGAVPAKTNMSQFNKVSGGIDQTIDFYSISSIQYKVAGGLTWANKNQHFSQFNHFNTYAEWFTVRSFNFGYYLLNNYEYSTANRFAQMHFKYSNQFLLIKRLPIMSNLLWTEKLWASALFVDGRKPYSEVGYSMGGIFFGGEIGVFTGFKGATFHGVGARATFVF